MRHGPAIGIEEGQDARAGGLEIGSGLVGSRVVAAARVCAAMHLGMREGADGGAGLVDQARRLRELMRERCAESSQ